jgi:hypothetical protein
MSAVGNGFGEEYRCRTDTALLQASRTEKGGCQVVKGDRCVVVVIVGRSLSASSFEELLTYKDERERERSQSRNNT